VLTATAAATVGAVAAAVALSPGAAGSPGRVRGEEIHVGPTTCAPNWRAPNAGLDHFAVRNAAERLATVYLFHPVSGRIVGRLRALAPGTAKELTVRLTPGTYMWGCDIRGKPRRTSDAEKVTRDPRGSGGPHVVPVTRDQLIPALQQYRTYVQGDVKRLVSQVATLRVDVDDADVTTAEADWLTAHLSWLRIGQDDGAYGAYGNLGRRIDGTSAGTVASGRGPRFTGFHKLESDLWAGRLTAAVTDVATLSRAVGTLAKRPIRASFPASTAGVGMLPLRSHEVLEDADRDTLTGGDDYGSGSGLRSVLADVAATRELLGLLTPLLAPRAPGLASRSRAALRRVVTVITSTRSNGSYPAVSALSSRQRERVDGAVGAALERLDRIPDLLAIGRS
jgi:high-affinity iron transporter